MSEKSIEHVKLPNWIEQENASRTENFARDLSDEKFLRHLNDILQPFEQQQALKELEPYPIIFFFGIPRCGKTVFSQLLVHALDLGYPDNVVARFWKAPTYGKRLSQILLKASGNEIGFSSNYGKTHNLSEPHDFAYFWHEWLNMDFPYDYEKAAATIDWEGLRHMLSLMSQEWGKCLLFKGVNPSYQITGISQTYRKTLFIFLERDFIDAAVSLRKGRLDNYGTLEKWYGQTPHPKTYAELIKHPYHEQIGGQFKHLVELYESQLAAIAPEKVLRISYLEFCHDPNGIMARIQSRIQSLYDVDIVQKNTIDPAVIKISQHPDTLPFYDELVEGLAKFGLLPRFDKSSAE